ncbi:MULTISPECIES: sensor histidine kinase [Pseudanabaena]|uniref:histidine kinase n=2 Tax=Pseudanabaena TaxID=1152 RepID=L8N2W4_9CYAN|nr:MULTISPECIES: HAMP domain-containing sensor histidine kinase [Pseudanabaena]ELS34577.1 histidine kinase [Pseudanabaena biceps PCC 7429]MDG3493259.1 HAMP domain-containing sensor histidine kinase [Pseudanabaena catenata USMAC16]
MLSASPDLIALARSQIILLTQSLGAVASAMYITENVADGMPPHLIEVAVFPEEGAIALPEAFSTEALPILSMGAGGLVRQRRFVLPLIYEEAILGFLMTGRDDRDWLDYEQSQIQQIANTLAIACALDRRNQWLAANQQRSYEEQNNFLASLLHQLRNPLTAIRTFAQLLSRRIVAEDPNQKFVTGILRETKHIQDLLSEADRPIPLLLSEAEHEKALLPAAMELTELDLSEILDAITNFASAIAQERNIQFLSNIPLNLPKVIGHESALREALGNLVENALKYTPERGYVFLGADVKPDTVYIYVQDTGVGIPEADLPRLFERNFRGRQADGDISGTGLGLAIANELVQKMEGSIHVISQVGKGSTFAVTLKRKG